MLVLSVGGQLQEREVLSYQGDGSHHGGAPASASAASLINNCLFCGVIKHTAHIVMLEKMDVTPVC